MSKIHRWQITGYTPCGRKITAVTTNTGRYLNDGVTCTRCLHAKSYFSMLWDDWNGQSDGAPDQRTPAEKAQAQRMAAFYSRKG
jgi:hypothetical protein